MKKALLTAIFLMAAIVQVSAVSSYEVRDSVAAESAVGGGRIKTNLFWLASGTPNLGFEIPIGQNLSAGVNLGLKIWDQFFPGQAEDAQNKKWRHLLVAPELRWWPDKVYEGWFFGGNLVYSHYNAGALKFPLGLYKDIRDKRKQGDLVLIGAFAGKNWHLSGPWRIEAEAGLGAGWTGYDYYDCVKCGPKLGSKDKVIVVPKLGLNLMYSLRRRAAQQQEPERPILQDTIAYKMPEPVAKPQRDRLILPYVKEHRGAVDSVNTPFLENWANYAPYTKERVMRKEKGAIRVYFPLSKTTLHETFKEGAYSRDNRPALDSIINITSLILADSIASVEKISIIGFASIEGPVQNNSRLGAGRALSLRKYIQGRFQSQGTKLQDDIFTLENGEEGWGEFRSQIEDINASPELAAAIGLKPEQTRKVLDIIGNENTDPKRAKETKLKALPFWPVIKDKVLREQRNSGYVRVFVSWVEDKTAKRLNEAVDLYNSGQTEPAKEIFKAEAVAGNADASAILKEIEAFEAEQARYNQYLKKVTEAMDAAMQNSRIKAQNEEELQRWMQQKKK